MPATKPKTARPSDATSRYLTVRRATEELCAGLSAEDCMLQSMPEASPVKWHLAHTTWFFETFLLAPHLRGYKPLNNGFRDLFNSYYNAVGDQPQRDRRGLFSRPTLQQVRDYREHVDQAILRLLASASPQVAELVIMGTHHEQQHQELIVTDFKHALWSSPLQPAWKRVLKGKDADDAAAPKLKWLPVEAGEAMIGHDDRSFCFDNELPRHKVLLQPFSIASRLTTNAGYLEFIADGGYRTPSLWLSDGWKTVQEQQWRAPLYWEIRDGEWWHYTVRGWRSVADDAALPVTHVSLYEADAFARWSEARLPTEFEWETAAREFAAEDDGNFLESGTLHPQRAHGGEFFGDCWQWTGSAYLPYPGYKAPKGALGEYNGKFMCNQMVLRGASCATPRSHARPSYRNFFPPATRWQFSGIRLARST